MKTTMVEAVSHPSAWEVSELSEDEWLISLDQAEIEELDVALQYTHTTKKPWGHFGASDFPLPLVGKKLERIANILRDGRGFALLRGIPVERYSLEDAQTIYWGVCSHLGEMAYQGADGRKIQPVEATDQYALNDPNRRNNLTSEQLYPHCDLTDVVSLMCLGQSKTGGESTVASSARIVNELLETDPEVIRLLSRPMYETTNMRFDDPTADPKRSVSDIAIPVFSAQEGRLACVFRRRRMVQGMERNGTPLSSADIGAMLKLEELANSDRFRLDMPFQLGDIQFLNNYVILHSRNAFVDAPEEGFKRRLLRIWFNLHDGMPLDSRVAAHMRRGWPPPSEAIGKAVASREQA